MHFGVVTGNLLWPRAARREIAIATQGIGSMMLWEYAQDHCHHLSERVLREKQRAAQMTSVAAESAFPSPVLAVLACHICFDNVGSKDSDNLLGLAASQPGRSVTWLGALRTPQPRDPLLRSLLHERLAHQLKSEIVMACNTPFSRQNTTFGRANRFPPPRTPVNSAPFMPA